ELAALLRNAEASPITRMHALYLLNNLGRFDHTSVTVALSDHDAIVRKNALRVLSERDLTTAPPELPEVTKLINDPDPRVKLNAFVALGTYLSAGLPREDSLEVGEAGVAA